MRRNNRAVVVYDPDYANPYGREVALLLTQTHEVRYAGASSSGWQPTELRRLPGHKFAKDGNARLVIIGSYFIVLSAVFFRILRGDTLIIVWCRTSIDRYAFGALAKLGRRIVYIVHNPKPRRVESARMARAERFLRTNCEIVIHSERLRHLLADDSLEARAEVVPHLPYKNYASHFSAGSSKRGGPRVLFLGQLRPDKSPGDMARFLEAFPRGGPETIVFCGRGELTSELKYASAGLGLVDKMDPDGVSDELLCAEVASADVLVAPYREVTQSGSIILAISFGVPVVSYCAGAVVDLVDPSCLAAPGDIDEILRLVLKILGQKEKPGSPDIDDWADRSLECWNGVLEDR